MAEKTIAAELGSRRILSQEHAGTRYLLFECLDKAGDWRTVLATGLPAAQESPSSGEPISTSGESSWSSTAMLM